MKILHVVIISLPIYGGHSIRNHGIFKELVKKLSLLKILTSVLSIDSYNIFKGSTFKIDSVKYSHLLTDKINNRYKKYYSNKLLNRPLQLFLAFVNYRIMDRSELISKYDIVHGHSGYNNGLSALLLAKKNKKPFIYDMHALSIDNIKKGSLKYIIAKHIEVKLMRNADAIIAIDPMLKEHISSKFGINKQKIFVAPNGIDASLFKKNSILNKKSIVPENSYVIGVDNSKGMENFSFIIDNINIIKEVFPNVTVLVFGSNEGTLAKHGNCFRFLPKIAYTEMPDYYSLLDLFIMPRVSNRMTETVTPLKLLEIMSCEIPVLISSVQGLTSCILNNESGFIYKVDSVTSFKSTLMLIKNQIGNSSIGLKGREWVKKNKSWDKSADEYISAYKYVLNKK